jgi:hypothetical protein
MTFSLVGVFDDASIRLAGGHARLPGGVELVPPSDDFVPDIVRRLRNRPHMR